MGGPLLDSNTSRIGSPNLRALAPHRVKGYQGQSPWLVSRPKRRAKGPAGEAPGGEAKCAGEATKQNTRARQRFATDCGSFTETVIHRETGYRCRTLQSSS